MISGWPVRCLDCESWSFTYKSDRTGNTRCYKCRKCDSKYVATWKGKPISSCMSEPQNTKIEDWDWAKVIPPDESDIIDVEWEYVDVPELVDGTPPQKLLVEVLS